MYLAENIKVHQLMARRVTVGKKNNKFSEALRLFQEYNLRHLPIVDDNDVLLGMVSATDLFKKFAEASLKEDVASFKDLNDSVKLEDIMTTEMITVGPEDLIKDMAAKLDENRISSVVVVDGDKRVVGIVTDKDVVHFLNLMMNQMDRLSRGSWGSTQSAQYD